MPSADAAPSLGGARSDEASAPPRDRLVSLRVLTLERREPVEVGLSEDSSPEVDGDAQGTAQPMQLLPDRWGGDATSAGSVCGDGALTQQQVPTFLELIGAKTATRGEVATFLELIGAKAVDDFSKEWSPLHRAVEMARGDEFYVSVVACRRTV